MTRDEVVVLMAGSKTVDEWNANCDTVKRDNDGVYPDYWFEEILHSGLAHRVLETCGESDAIEIKLFTEAEL